MQTPCLCSLPIGAEENFEGIVDLVRMKAIYWEEENMGMNFEEREIPDEMLEDCQQYHESLVESAAEANEALMDKYLEEGELSVEDILEGLRIQTLANEIVCVFCGTAFKNKGVQTMLDGIVDLMPSPLDVPAYHRYT